MKNKKKNKVIKKTMKFELDFNERELIYQALSNLKVLLFNIKEELFLVFGGTCLHDEGMEKEYDLRIKTIEELRNKFKDIS